MKAVSSPSFSHALCAVALLAGLSFAQPCWSQTGGLAPGVRGLATRAPAGMKIDGDLSEFKDAFCTPVEYFNENLRERAAQFFYMWDDEAFYAALRTLDTKPADLADDNHLWEGDAVEWYFDTRQDASFRSQAWGGKGSVHCYWTGLKNKEVQGRFCLRPNYLDAIPKIGVEVAARRTKVGMDVEFKLPWANFPGFKAALNTVIALDAEVCYSDGGGRVYRSFAFGSPLSVQQPANLGRIQLVDHVAPEHWAACGPVMFPVRCDTPWTQPEKPQVTAYLAIPPNRAEDVGKVVFRVLGLDGAVLAERPGTVETFEAEGAFRRAKAQWPADLAAPGAYQLLGVVYGKSGAELARVAPRMVSVNMAPGY